MTTGHLVAHADLTLLGDIDLGHLHDTRGEFVTDRNIEFLTAQLGIILFVFLQVVDDGGTNQLILGGIGRPLAHLYGGIVDLVEDSLGKLGSLGNDVGTHEVFHTLRNLTLSEDEQLVDENGFQAVHLLFILFVELGQNGFVAQFRFFLLDGTREEVGTDNYTFQRGGSFQRSIFHIAGLVAKDGAQQLLFGRRIRLAFGGNLTNHDVTGVHLSTHTDNTAFVEVLGGIFAHVGNIGGELFHTALGLTHFERILVDVNRGEDIFTNHALVQHDGVLVVVTLPRHEGHFEVAAQSQLAVLGRITFGENVAGFHTVALVADRTQVNRGALVGLAEFRELILFNGIFETYKLFVLGAVVADTNHGGVDKLDNTGTFGHNLGARVAYQLALDTGSYDRSLGTQQRYGLAHHVRSHQRTVGIVVFEEGNERCGNRGDLSRRHVHQVHLVGRHDGEVGIQTGFYLVADKGTVVIERGITLSDNLTLFNLGGQVDNTFGRQVHFSVFYLTVRSFDET